MLLPHRVERLVAQHLESAIGQGLAAAALVELDGSIIAIANTCIAEDELRPLVMSAVRRVKNFDLTTGRGAGEMLSFTLDDREVAFGIVDSLCIIAVLSATSGAQLNLACAQHDFASDLRDKIARVLPKRDRSAEPLPPAQTGGSGGTGSEPADLQVIEYGITVRRDRDKT